MKLITILSDDSTDSEVSSFLDHVGFTEKLTSDKIQGTHYIVINKYLRKFELSNRVKEKGIYIDATTSEWRPKLMEQLNAKHVPFLYPFRPKEPVVESLERLREKHDWSQSQTVEYVVKMYFRDNPS